MRRLEHLITYLQLAGSKASLGSDSLSDYHTCLKTRLLPIRFLSTAIQIPIKCLDIIFQYGFKTDYYPLKNHV